MLPISSLTPRATIHTSPPARPYGRNGRVEMNESAPSADRPLAAEDLLAATARAAAQAGIGSKRRRRAFWWKLMVLLWIATAVASLALIATLNAPPAEEGEHQVLAFLSSNLKTAALVALALFGSSVFSMVVFWLNHRVVSNAMLAGQLEKLSQSTAVVSDAPSPPTTSAS